LPDGIFSNQKYQVEYIKESLAMEDVGIFSGHWVNFLALWYISRHYGTFSPFLVYLTTKNLATLI
jgi:hypothetical protein